MLLGLKGRPFTRAKGKAMEFDLSPTPARDYLSPNFRTDVILILSSSIRSCLRSGHSPLASE